MQAFSDMSSNQPADAYFGDGSKEGGCWVKDNVTLLGSDIPKHQSSFCLSQAFARSFLFGVPCVAGRAGQLLGKSLCWVQDLLG